MQINEKQLTSKNFQYAKLLQKYRPEMILQVIKILGKNYVRKCIENKDYHLNDVIFKTD